MALKPQLPRLRQLRRGVRSPSSGRAVSSICAAPGARDRAAERRARDHPAHRRCWAKESAVTYAVSTGNEAYWRSRNFSASFDRGRAYARHRDFRRADPPSRSFLALPPRASEAQKPIVMIHPGEARGARIGAVPHRRARRQPRLNPHPRGAMAAPSWSNPRGTHRHVRALVRALRRRPPASPSYDSGAFKGMALDSATR